VVTGVAEQIPERISKLVYLDALIPEDGQSYVDMFSPAFVEAALQVVQTIGEGWKFYANFSDPRFTAQPYKTGLEKLSVKNPVASRLPRVFIYCTEGKTGEDLGLIPVTQAAERARSDPNWGYYEIPADHGAVFDHPDWVTEVLLKLA
jgi:pimeloyl-ACP methyl ester carboxylesterase